MTPRLVVVGGGMAGLAAALELAEDARRGGLTVTLVEREERLGGLVATDHPEDLVVERGPDCFLAHKQAGQELARRLGLEAELEGMNPEVRGAAIHHRGRLHPIPEGLVAGIPPSPQVLWRTDLLDPWGRLRALGGALLPARLGPEDDPPLGPFLRARLGAQVVDRLVVPLVAGMAAGEADRLSLRATLPELARLLEQGGTLFAAVQRARAARRRTASGASPFLTLRRGLGALVEAAAQSLDGVRLLRGVAVETLAPRGTEGGYRLSLADGTVLEAEGVILATSAPAAARLTSRFPELAEPLTEVPASSLTVAAFVLAPGQVRTPVDRTGFLVPPGEGLGITAATWLNVKFRYGRPLGQPPDRLAVRVFLQEDVARRAGGEAELLHYAWSQLGRVVGLEGTPRWQALYRLPDALPQYVVGHEDRVRRLEAAQAARGDLWLAGNYLRGVGLPDCIRSGQMAARAARQRLLPGAGGSDSA